MLRKVILGVIMGIAAIIIIVALNRQGKGPTPISPETEMPPTEIGDRTETGKQFEITKVNKSREVVFRIKGEKAVSVGDGPIKVTKPKITISSNPRRIIIITADRGVISGEDREHLENVLLTENVLVEVIPLEGDVTELTCDELEFIDRDEQVRIPGSVLVKNPAFLIEGKDVEGSGALGRLVLKKDVRVTILRGVGPLWERLEGEGGSSRAKPADRKAKPVPLVITCAGALEFEDDKSQATFHKDVKIVQGPDSAVGDRMLVVFERGKHAEKKSDKTSSDEEEIDIRRIVLHGTDVDRVHVTGPGRDGWGEQLVFDTEAAVARLTGRNARLIQRDEQVTTRFEGTEIVFGEGVAVPDAVVLPKRMKQRSNKVMILGEPARLTHRRKGAKSPQVLTGQIILIDSGASAVLVGGINREVHVKQSGLELFGKSVTLYEKTVEDGESVEVAGPGRVIVSTEADKDKDKDSRKPPRKPTVVEFAKTMLFHSDTGKAVFSGQVVLTDGSSKLRCRRLEATVPRDVGKGGEGAPGVRDMVARGDVVAEDGDQKLIGEQLTFHAGKLKKMTLSGRDADRPAEVKWGKSFLRCPHITYSEEDPDADGIPALRRVLGTGGGYLHLVSKEKTDTAQKTEVWFAEKVDFEEKAADGRSRAIFSEGVRCVQGAMQVTSDVMTVALERAASATDADAGRAFGSLEARVIECAGDVKLDELVGRESDRKRAYCDLMTWDRTKNEVKLLAQPGRTSGRTCARVLQGGNILEAPVIRALVTDRGMERSLTEGGGTLVCFSRSSAGAGAEPQRMTITWNGTGRVEPDPAQKQTGQSGSMVATFKGQTVSRSERDELTGDVLKVYMRPVEPEAGAEAKPVESARDREIRSRLDVQRVVAIGNVKAKLYDAKDADYRYARGGRLSWERLSGRIILAGPDAIAWGRPGQWRGEKVLIRRRSDGTLFIHSAGTELVFFVDERKAAARTEPADLDEWEPLD